MKNYIVILGCYITSRERGATKTNPYLIKPCSGLHLVHQIPIHLPHSSLFGHPFLQFGVKDHMVIKNHRRIKNIKQSKKTIGFSSL